MRVSKNLNPKFLKVSPFLRMGLGEEIFVLLLSAIANFQYYRRVLPIALPSTVSDETPPY